MAMQNKMPVRFGSTLLCSFKPILKRLIVYFDLQDWMLFTKHARESTGLERRTCPTETVDVSNLPEVVQKAVQDALPYYHQLLKISIKL